MHIRSIHKAGSSLRSAETISERCRRTLRSESITPKWCKYESTLGGLRQTTGRARHRKRDVVSISPSASPTAEQTELQTSMSASLSPECVYSQSNGRNITCSPLNLKGTHVSAVKGPRSPLRDRDTRRQSHNSSLWPPAAAPGASHAAAQQLCFPSSFRRAYADLS